MGRLLFLILSLCFLLFLINFSLGDVRELFNHPEGDRRRTRDDNVDKSNLNYDNDEKAMDELYSSLDEYDGNNKRQTYNFDEPDFEKHLVDALNRIKYIGNDFNKNEPHNSVNGDLNLANGNSKNSYDNNDINNSNNNMNEDDKGKVENYEIDEFGNLNRKHRAKVDDNGKDLTSLKFSNKKQHNNYYKRNGYNSFHSPRRNQDEENRIDSANYDGNDNIDYYENEFLMRNNRRNNKNNLKDDEPKEEIDNRKGEEEVRFNKESEPFVGRPNNNNVLHASLKKNVDKNYLKHPPPPFDGNAEEVVKYKRNLRAVNGCTNLDYSDDGSSKSNSLDVAANDELKSVNDENINCVKSTRQNKKKKRSEKFEQYGVNNNVSDKVIQDQNKNSSNDVEKSRSRRKQDEIKIVSNDLEGGNSNSKTPNFNNKPNNNYNNINNNEIKLVKVKDDRIRLNLGGGNSGLHIKNDLAQLVMDSNMSRFVSVSSVGGLVSTPLPTMEPRSKASPRGYRTQGGSLQSAAVAGCPYGFRSTTLSPGARRKIAKSEALENLRGMYVVPQLKFNVSSNSTDDIRVAHEINDFVANLLYNAGRTGNMRKELGLCKGYDKRLPFHINKPFDDKLLKGLMECLTNIIKGSLENQKCSEMPPELKMFVDWLLLNGISARDEFRQFMASDSSQRKLFLFPSEGVCEKNGEEGTSQSSVLSTGAGGSKVSSNSNSTDNTPSTPLDHAKAHGGKPTKLFNTLKKLYYSPGNMFSDGSSNVEKSANKNPYTLFKRYLGDRKFYLSPSDIYDQKIYQNSPLYNNIAPYDNDDANDWNVRNPLMFDNEDEDKYDNDMNTALLGPPARIDLSQYYNNRPGIRRKPRRHDFSEFESPSVYGGDDE